MKYCDLVVKNVQDTVRKTTLNEKQYARKKTLVQVALFRNPFNCLSN